MTEELLTCPKCGATYEDTFATCPEDGTPLGDDAEAQTLVGVYAGRFRVLKRLGKGGMGSVYLADDLRTDRRVALKILRRELAGDPAMVARFQREAKASSRIDSPHVVTLYDVGETEDGELYLVMEYLIGEGLGDRLESEQMLPPTTAVRIAREIALALAAAHAANVVHRDLKPDNVILVEPRDTVKVLDFGIAKLLEHEPTSSQLTRAGTLVGTAAYMSPEACARRPVGPPGDLYALGVLLFEMLVGRLPFDDPEVVLLMGMHLRVPPELITEASPDLSIPEDLESLVDELLAKDPAARPGSAVEVAQRLDALDMRSPQQPGPASMRSPAPPKAPARTPLAADTAAPEPSKARVGVPVAIAAVVVAGLVGFLIVPPSQSPATSALEAADQPALASPRAPPDPVANVGDAGATSIDAGSATDAARQAPDAGHALKQRSPMRRRRPGMPTVTPEPEPMETERDAVEMAPAMVYPGVVDDWE